MFLTWSSLRCVVCSCASWGFDGEVLLWWMIGNVGLDAVGWKQEQEADEGCGWSLSFGQATRKVGRNGFGAGAGLWSFEKAKRLGED